MVVEGHSLASEEKKVIRNIEGKTTSVTLTKYYWVCQDFSEKIRVHLEDLIKFKFCPFCGNRVIRKEKEE